MDLPVRLGDARGNPFCDLKMDLTTSVSEDSKFFSLKTSERADSKPKSNKGRKGVDSFESRMRKMRSEYITSFQLM